VIAATGFVALGAEVMWTRFLGLVIRNTVFTYALTLSVVLLGIVVGSLAAAAWIDRMKNRAAWLGALQALNALIVLALFGLPPAFWRSAGDELTITFLLLAPSAVLSGAAFPLAARMAAPGAAGAAKAVGHTAAVNTLGGIAGSLAIGFLALPHLGLQGSALLITGIGIAAAILTWLFLSPPALGPRVAAAATVAAWLALPALTDTRVPVDFLAPRSELVDHREGLQSNLAVVEREGVRMLEIDRWWQGQSRRTHQIMAAHLPMLLHPAPRRVLVVGAGAGQTPSRVALYPIEKLDVVDIEPSVFDLIRPHFESAWMSDPRVRLLRADGRNLIAHSGAQYDVISLEVGQIFRPGVASFYTEDFYRAARARLTPGGMVSQFVPIGFLAPEMFRSVIGGFLAVFPTSMLWYNTTELLLIGVNADGLAIDRARIDRLTASGPIHEDLRYAHWGGREQWLHQPHVLLGGYLTGPRGLATVAAGAAPLRDDRPLLEYATSFVDELHGHEVANLDLLRPRLEPIDGLLRPPVDATTATAIRRTRDGNLGQILAQTVMKRLAVTPFASDSAIAILERALAYNPDTPKAVRLMGEALAARGRMAEAERHLARAVELRPDDPVARRSLAAVFARQGRAAEALAQERAVLELGVDDPEVRARVEAAGAAAPPAPASPPR
jgi:spermidine synthase